MTLSGLIENLGDKMGIDNLALGEDGQCSILFDGEHEITFANDADDESVILFCEVGEFNRHDAAQCVELLSASMLGAETGGAALSVHVKRDTVVLWKRYSNDIPNLPAFEQAINSFLPFVIEWKKRLAKSDVNPEVSTAPDVAPHSLDSESGAIFV